MKLETMTFDQIYLIYVNDFLTIEKMAEYYHVHPDLLKMWIDCGKDSNNSNGEDWEQFQEQVNTLYFNLI